MLMDCIYDDLSKSGLIKEELQVSWIYQQQPAT
jgi:hypothetical protein